MRAGSAFVRRDSTNEVALSPLQQMCVRSRSSGWLPTQDHGFMYGRSFQDPESHVVEVLWMDVSALPDATDASGSAAAHPAPARVGA